MPAPPRDGEQHFRAELALAFGIFEVLVTAFNSVSELLWGTAANGWVFAAGVVAIAPVLAWLLRGGDPDRVGAALMAIMFTMVTVVNLGTGGRSLGANMALPTLALFAVLVGRQRAGLLWLLAILLEIVVVGALRHSRLAFPIRPDPDWVASAIDRIPFFLSLGSALIGWLTLRALDRYRRSLHDSTAAEARAREQASSGARRFSDFAAIAADGFWETDADLHLSYVSPGFAQSIGLPPDDMLGFTPEEAYLRRYPDAQGTQAYMEPLLARRAFEAQLLYTVDGAGRLQVLQNQGRPYLDGVGRFAGFRGVIRVVTEQRRAEAALSESELRLRLVADNMPALISYFDRDRRLRFVNRMHSELVGLPPERLLGRTIAEAIGAKAAERLAPRLEEAFAGARVSFEVRARGREWQVTYVPAQVDGVVTGVYGLASDVTRLKQIEHELSRLARSDALTGLPNRRSFEEKIAEAIARSERSGAPMALLYLDLDRFKQINDSLGHKRGDEVLQEFARRLRETVREIDTVARLAGDEFVVLVENLALHDSVDTVALKIIAAMQPPMRLGDIVLPISASIGIAIRRAGETDADALLQRADRALYLAKQAGGAGFQVDDVAAAVTPDAPRH
jgi:diguanylate cyclase (GGDEF)-like protein/PAS domain S-box-containing protein